MKLRTGISTWLRRAQAAFTLEEVIMSVAISAVSLSGVVSGYVLTAERAEWSACSAAANRLSVQRLEQARVARWDPNAAPSVDELTAANFPATTQALGLPDRGSGSVMATNTTTITTVSWSPQIRMIRTTTTWRFLSRGVYTNTVVAYRTPDS